MQRVTLRIPKSQVAEVEALVERGEYPNRSEAIRAAVREMLREDRTRQGKRPLAPREYRNTGGNGVAEVNPGP